MRKRVHAAAAAVWIFLFGLASCDTELARTTWEPVDHRGELHSMLFLTGRLVTAESPDFQGYLGSYAFGLANCLLTLSATLSKLAVVAAVDVEEESTDTDEWVLESGVLDELPQEPDTEVLEKGTLVYLELACPGPFGQGLGRDFQYGSIRIESGDLTDYSLHNLFNGAQLLFSLNACQTPAFTVDLQAAGYLLGGFNGIVLDLLPFPFQLGNIRAKSAFVTQDGGSVLIDAERAGTFRLDVTLKDEKIELTIVAANGAVSCLFDDWGKVFFGCVLNK